MEEIRVRFAPSPTGPLHLGGVRTALFNFLFAKKEKGKFILRIEDTDIQRSKEEYTQDILESLKWLGIFWDEGPYFQSERKEIYKKYLEKLIKENNAYFCFCQPEELEAQRQYFLSIGQTPRYSGKCRDLTPKEREKLQNEGKKWVIRFKTPSQKLKLKDLLRGEIEYDLSLIGDFVIAKSFEEPLYNFTVVVDDAEMRISHVIRGEDHLPNTPKQIAIFKALNLTPPKYLHLPLLLGEDKTKLSKRHGDLSIRKFKEDGFLKEAIINFVALLGWTHPQQKEIFSFEELKENFSLERLHKNPAVVNLQKLEWINSVHIKHKNPRELTFECLNFLLKNNILKEIKSEVQLKIDGEEKLERKFEIIESGEIINFQYLERVVKLFQERLKKLSEIVSLSDFFFKKNLNYPKTLLYWQDAKDKETKENLQRVIKILQEIPTNNWEAQIIGERLSREAEKDKNKGYIFWPLRVALTGKENSPPPQEIAEIFGKEKTLKRVEEAIKML